MVCGRIDSVNEPQHRSGQTEKGKKYEFYQQTISLAMGGSSVDVNFRSEHPISSPLTENHLDEIRRFKVGNPRTYNGKLSFDAID
jgi:hypothetical protein